MAKTKQADVAGALAAMRQAPTHGRGRKSPVYQWLAARHDALATAFEAEPPSWPALARYLGDNGVMASDGSPPSAAAVRSAWIRVRDVTARRRAKTGALPPERQSKPQPATMPTPPTFEDDEPAGDQPLPADFTFTPVRNKD